ncbi:LysR family transcriptional regulator [Lampropedia cohaerens]|uniref:LysR family transcriptional regulator n=1 Tax=Lampropedia cohaerens TaxID=1610491 RepID=A0A0U1PZX7_9BURK|nr:LysR family transcriptional regulator [Lampropedia cohaerens]KKW68059.1 LysR family transcriptional regulator [Lampropedia cohaerens]
MTPSSLALRHERSLPDLHALETFLAVCEAGSMSLAAQHMGVSQSAVSQMVKTLENTYGVALLDREVRPARPTPAGSILLEMAEALLTQARDMAEQLRQRVRQDHAQIRLGCVDSFAATVGPALIHALSGSARELQLWSGLTPGLNSQLLARDLDLAICTEVPTDPRVTQHLLLSESWVAVFPKNVSGPLMEQGVDNDTKRLRAQLQALPQLPLIRYTLRSVIGQQIERFIRHLGLSFPQRYAFDATDPLLSMVAAGLGWAISTPLCLWQSRAWLDEVQVVSLPATRLGQRDFHLLCRERQWSASAEEIATLTRRVLLQNVIPDLRRAMPALGTDVVSLPSAASFS